MSAPTAPFTLRIESEALAYLLPHVSKEESRPILNSVCFEPCGLGVATNGHTLLADTGTCTGAPATILLRFHEPRKLVAKKVTHLFVDVAPGNATVPVRMMWHGALLGMSTASLVEGPYPNWRAVMPTPTWTLDPMAFQAIDPNVLARFVPLGRDLVGGVSLAFYGHGKAIGVSYTHPSASSGGYRYGLCMPINYRSAESDHSHTWILESRDWPHAMNPDDPRIREAYAAVA